MRPTFGWRDLSRFERIGVWGLGVEGEANQGRLAQLGVEPLLVDDRPRDAGVVATSEGGLERLRSCDLVIKTPGISRYRDDVIELEARGIPVVGGLGLWLNDVDVSKVICVTGTKGKSTTVSIAGHLARGLGVNCFVGGNIGVPPYDPAVPTDFDLWVIETSSYQATDLGVTPPVVGVTSLNPDHLDWHRSVDAYYRDKLSLTSQPGARLTVCGDDELLRARRSLLGPEVRWVTAAEGESWAGALGLVGRHNTMNAAVAAAVLEAAGVPGADDPRLLATAGSEFPPLDSRLRLAATVAGVEFYDDSLSTNVLPTIAAVDSFPGRPVAVLVGGFDRGIDYAPLAEHLAARAAPTLALTLPDCGDRIAEAIRATTSSEVEVIGCEDVEDAVCRGFGWMESWPAPGVVLLSPAAPSFGRFGDYRERARAFTDAIDRLPRDDART